MKKICLLLLVILGGSCNTNYNHDKQAHRGNKYSHLEQRITKQASKRKVRPTESMQIGLNNNRKYDLNGGLDDKRDVRDEYANNNQDIANNFIADDGSYVGKYKIGNQYEVFGVTYQPQEYDNFEEEGTASWYGEEFNGKPTANGEIYHKGDMTAAHPTLPLPSMVRITNLENGKSAKVRVNDRGPFSKKRITDVSEGVATELGFKNKGTARVKLEFLKDDTERLLDRLNLK